MSQQRQLETLQRKRREGKFPVVRVGDEDREFVAVFFGGSSPTVSLADASGRVEARSVADWKRLGAEFSARSRSLARSYVAATPASPGREYAVRTEGGTYRAYRASDAAAAQRQHEAARGTGPGERVLSVDLVTHPSDLQRKPSGVLQREIEAYLSRTGSGG
jgi:hypothetical protein